MHKAEEVRFLTVAYTGEDHGAAVKEALLSYAALLEAMEEADKDVQWMAAAAFNLRQRAEEILRSKG